MADKSQDSPNTELIVDTSPSRHRRAIPSQELASKFATFGEFEEELLRNEREMGVAKYRVLMHAIRSGELLKRIKKTLKHGEFGTWVKTVAQTKLGLSHRTVNRYLLCYDKRQAIQAAIRRELTKLGVSPSQDAIEAKLATLSLREVDDLLTEMAKPKPSQKSGTDESAENNSVSTTSAESGLPKEWQRAIKYFLIDSSPHPCSNINYLISESTPEASVIRERHLVAIIKNYSLAGWIDLAQAALDRDELDVGLFLIIGDWNADLLRALCVYPAFLRPYPTGLRCLLGVMTPNRQADFYRAFQALSIGTVPQALIPNLVQALS